MFLSLWTKYTVAGMCSLMRLDTKLNEREQPFPDPSFSRCFSSLSMLSSHQQSDSPRSTLASFRGYGQMRCFTLCLSSFPSSVLSGTLHGNSPCCCFTCDSALTYILQLPKNVPPGLVPHSPGTPKIQHSGLPSPPGAVRLSCTCDPMRQLTIWGWWAGSKRLSRKCAPCSVCAEIAGLRSVRPRRRDDRTRRG